jgi:hypothetical protein
MPNANLLTPGAWFLLMAQIFCFARNAADYVDRIQTYQLGTARSRQAVFFEPLLASADCPTSIVQ